MVFRMKVRLKEGTECRLGGNWRLGFMPANTVVNVEIASTKYRDCYYITDGKYKGLTLLQERFEVVDEYTKYDLPKELFEI